MATTNTFDEEVSKLTHNRTNTGIEELLLERAKHDGRVEEQAVGKIIGEENKSR
jgi:hypothetical protein